MSSQLTEQNPAQELRVATGVSSRPQHSAQQLEPSRPANAFKKWATKEGSAYAFLSLYALMFTTFIVIPVLVAFFLSFTFFDTIQTPTFIGLKNYIILLTQDDIFMRYVLPNTIKFAVFVGPGGYLLAIMLA